jgi:hypothetical protein
MLNIQAHGGSMVKPFEHDAVGIGWNTEENALQVTKIDLADKQRTPRYYDRLRKKFGDLYRSPLGKKYAVIFYQVTETKQLVITDFFRCILVDPDFYVRHQLRNGILAIAVDEFAACHKWLSSAKKKTDYGIYTRAGQLLAKLWRCDDVGDQLSKENFELISGPLDKKLKPS